MGWDEPVYRNESEGKGGSTPVIAGYVRKYSDKCLELYNRAHNREVYGERGDGGNARGNFQYVVILPQAPAPGQVGAAEAGRVIEMEAERRQDGVVPPQIPPKHWGFAFRTRG